MKLNDLDSKNYAVKALKESFDYKFDPSNLNKDAATKMLKKVQGLKQEMRTSKDFYENQSSPSYMKLVFMEQALTEHIINNKPRTARIVVENEEVEKSQVVLAAQDLVDSVRKMIEQVSDMLVKELPALSDSIQSEIGVNESEQFTGQANEALTSLQAALTQSEQGLKSALNSITGQGGADFGGEIGEPMPTAGEEDGADLGMEMPDEEPGLTAETPPEPEEEEPAGSIGRLKR